MPDFSAFKSDVPFAGRPGGTPCNTGVLHMGRSDETAQPMHFWVDDAGTLDEAKAHFGLQYGYDVFQFTVYSSQAMWQQSYPSAVLHPIPIRNKDQADGSPAAPPQYQTPKQPSFKLPPGMQWMPFTPPGGGGAPFMSPMQYTPAPIPPLNQDPSNLPSSSRPQGGAAAAHDAAMPDATRQQQQHQQHQYQLSEELLYQSELLHLS